MKIPMDSIQDVTSIALPVVCKVSMTANFASLLSSGEFTLTVKKLYGISTPLACMIMKIAVGFPTPLHIGIQPVIVHNLKFSLTFDSKRDALSFIIFFILGMANTYFIRRKS